MKTVYQDHRQSSSITHVDPFPDGITVFFGAKAYRYETADVGEENMKTMKRLAAAGLGLATFIRSNKLKHRK